MKEIISGELVVRGGEPLDGPIPLWNTSRARQKFPVLQMLANGYLAGFPLSSCPERVGSAISCVATKLRGRLTQRMVNALATLHYDYAEQDRIKKRQWTRQRASRVVVSANDPKFQKDAAVYAFTHDVSPRDARAAVLRERFAPARAPAATGSAAAAVAAVAPAAEVPLPADDPDDEGMLYDYARLAGVKFVETDEGVAMGWIRIRALT